MITFVLGAAFGGAITFAFCLWWLVKTTKPLVAAIEELGGPDEANKVFEGAFADAARYRLLKRARLVQ